MQVMWRYASTIIFAEVKQEMFSHLVNGILITAEVNLFILDKQELKLDKSAMLHFYSLVMQPTKM